MDVMQTLLATGTGPTGVTPAGVSPNADMLLNGASVAASPAVPSSAGLFAQVLSLLQQGSVANNQSAKLSALAGTVALINKDENTADATKEDLAVTALDLAVNPAMAGMMAQMPVLPVQPVNPASDVTDNIVVGSDASRVIVTADQVISTLNDMKAVAEAKVAANSDLLPSSNVVPLSAPAVAPAAVAALAPVIEAVAPFTLAQASELVSTAALQQNNTPVPTAAVIEEMVQNAVKDAVKQVAVPQYNQDNQDNQVPAPSSIATAEPATTELPVTSANTNNAPASNAKDKFQDVLVKTDATVPSAQDNAATVTDVIAAKAAAPVQQEVVTNLAKNPSITLAQEPAKSSDKETATAKPDVKDAASNDTSNKVAKAEESTDNETTEDQDSSSFLSDNSQKQHALLKSDGVKKPEFAHYQTAVLTPPPAEQITVSVTKALKDGDGNISIHLKPMDLGRVDVRVEYTADGKATIHIAAEKQDTLNLLQKDSQNLEKSLADAGLKAESGSLNFSLRDGSGSQQGRRESQQQPFANAYPTQSGEENIESKIAGIKHYTGHISMNNGLDIRV